MSHSLTLQVRCYNDESIINAAEKVGAEADMTVKERRMYDGRTIKGKSVKLKDWKYPCVIDGNGVITYDNFNNAWGNISRLHKFTQHYASDAARRAAVADGLTHIATTEEGNLLVSRFIPADGRGQVVLKIPADGSPALVDVLECAGAVCETLTAGLAAAIGVTQSQELKQEYYADQQAHNEETH
jgi:hypothetical protein